MALPVPDRRRGAVAVGAVLFLLGATVIACAGPVGADSVTAPQLQALAARAVDDPRALAQLRAVTDVDGQPVDIGPALAGAEGPALAARLRVMAGPPAAGGGAPAVAPGDARTEAGRVLDGRRFQPSRVPRPLKGVLTTMGRWLQPLVEPFGGLWDRVRGSLGTQLALAVLVFVATALISLRLVRRRGPGALDRSRPVGVAPTGLDPDRLEREAAAAEEAGDFGHAVRLRFVAGILRLDRAGAISYRSSMTTGQLARGLRSPTFAGLAGTFDEIAYGGRAAQASDVHAARSAWPAVLAEARR